MKITGTQTRWQFKMISAGRCKRCGDPARPGRQTCEPCAEKQAQASREARELCRSIGICTKCQKRDARPGFSNCTRCATHFSKKNRAARKAAEN